MLASLGARVQAPGGQRKAVVSQAHFGSVDVRRPLLCFLIATWGPMGAELTSPRMRLLH